MVTPTPVYGYAQPDEDDFVDAAWFTAQARSAEAGGLAAVADARARAVADVRPLRDAAVVARDGAVAAANDVLVYHRRTAFMLMGA